MDVTVSLTATGSDLLARIRAAGADIRVDEAGMRLLRGASLSPDLLAAAKANRDAVRAALDCEMKNAPIRVTCRTCGGDACFEAITNPDQWQCAACLPPSGPSSGMEHQPPAQPASAFTELEDTIIPPN